MPQKVTSDNFKTEILNADKAVTEFYSDSCVPCKRMAPVFAELEEENPNIKFAKVNVNFNEELSGEYDVLSSPTILFFKNGIEITRTKGIVTKEELKEKINLLN